jgi:putative flavoprotein involved in K+ transport
VPGRGAGERFLQRAAIPAVAAALPASIRTLTVNQYRRPDQLEAGGVLVVGASASGTQIAEEIQRSGRQVTVAVGEHIRVPRVYRGRDIMWWMDGRGCSTIATTRSTTSIARATCRRFSWRIHRSPHRGPQSTVRTRRASRRTADGHRRRQGAVLGSLRNVCALSDLKMNRLLERIDTWATAQGLDGEVDAPQRFEPTRVEDSPPLGFELGDIRTVIWATGFHPDYSWLDVPVFDRKGRIQHDGGVVHGHAMYVMGLPFLRRRRSTFIDGATADAQDLSAHLAGRLDHALS